MQGLKQSTAITYPIFVHDAAGDAVTGLTNASFTKTISKNGGAFGAMTVTITELADGWYSVPISASHTDTLGMLSITFTNAGAKQVNLQWRVEVRILDDLAYPNTSGRGIDVTAGGGVGIDWANVENQGTAVDLSATDIQLVDTTTVNTDMVSEPPTAAANAIAVWDKAIEDHDTQGNMGWAQMLSTYAGSDGPGIYIDSGAANTNTVVGTDGTEINPVSTFAAARTLADAVGLKIYYLEGNSDITLAATHTDWEFIGIGSVMDNVINLGSQDVSRSLFRNLTVEGIQGGAGRITARDCALQDPGAGDTILHVFAERCGFVDRIQVDTSADNVFDQCYSLVAGTAAPVIQATGAAGTISVRHYSGGMEFETLSASHNVTWEGIGQVIFNADCNVNANVSVRGVGSITDNTAGMSSLTETSLVNMTKINTEVDTALIDVRLDEFINATAGAVKPVIGSMADQMMNKDGSQTFSPTTDSLEGAADAVAGLNDLSQAQILDDATPFSGADIATILTNTAEIGTAGAGLTAVSRAVNPQKNVALSDITFLMVDSTNHNPAAGLTVTGERSIDGGAFSAVTGTIAEISDGIYQLDASQADMNGDMIMFRFSEGTSDDTFYFIKTAA